MKKLFYILSVWLTAHTAVNAQGPCGAVNAGPNRTVCYESNKGILLSATTTGLPNVYWTTISSDTSMIIRKDTLNSVYFPLQSALSQGYGMLVAHNSSVNCVETTDTVRINFIPLPFAKIISDSTNCLFDSIPLTASNSAGNTFTWKGGDGHFVNDIHSQFVVYFAGPQDKISGNISLELVVTSSEGCTNSDVISYQKGRGTFVNAGPDESSCIGGFQLQGSVHKANNVVWSSSGNGTFSPNNTTLNAIYNPGNIDTDNQKTWIILQANEENGCGFASDTMIISYGKPTLELLISELSTCQDSIIADAKVTGASGVIWNSSGSGYFRKVFGFENHYHFSAADKTLGSVVLTATTSGNGNCAANSKNVNITVYPSIVVNAGPDQQRQGYTTAELSGIIENSSIGSWYTNGTGTFSNQYNLQTIYSASAQDLALGFIDITLQSATSTNCAIKEDQVRIYFSNKNYLNGKIVAIGDTSLSGVVYLYRLAQNTYFLETFKVANPSFNFNNITDGTYLLLAQPTSDNGKYLPTYFTSATDWHDASPISLSGGNTSTLEISLKSFILPDSLWIGNDSISGNVTTSGNAANARISANVVNSAVVLLQNSKGETLASTTTSANGNYTFKNIAAGIYTVVVDYPGNARKEISVAVDGNPATASIANATLQTEIITGLFGNSFNAGLDLKLFPNPVKEILNLTLSAEMNENSVIRIFENTGKNVLTASVTAGNSSMGLDVQSLPQGFYIIQVSNGKNTIRNKFYKTN